MFEFIKLMIDENAINKMKDVWDFQNTNNWQYLECAAYAGIDVMYNKRNEITFTKCWDSNDFGKSVILNSERITLQHWQRTSYLAKPKSAINTVMLEYNSTEEYIFQLSTLYDTSYINADVINTCIELRNIYIPQEYL